MSDESAICERRKVRLEIALLEWQNSRLGRLTQLTAIFTVAVTILTVFATLIGWGFDRISERQLRERELSERTENQYRSDIQLLLRYPIDESQTIPYVIFIVNDLSALLRDYSGEEASRRKLEIGTLLAELKISSDFDLGKPRNAEFDFATLKFCDSCSEATVNAPRYTKAMLEKYATALAPFHKEDEDFKKVYKIEGTDTFTIFRTLESLEKSGFKMKLRQFVTMVRAYELHLGSLTKALQKDAKDSDGLKNALGKYTCDFNLATQNRILTKQVFHVDDQELDTRMDKCIK